MSRFNSEFRKEKNLSTNFTNCTKKREKKRRPLTQSFTGVFAKATPTHRRVRGVSQSRGESSFAILRNEKEKLATDNTEKHR